MSLSNTINYSTPGNFTFSNSDEIEISGSVLTLKQLVALQGAELFYIPFTTAEEFAARRKTGSVITETEEVPGNIDYSSGIAQLPGAQLDYWGVPLDNFVPSAANDFEIQFKWKAPYSGSPSITHDLFVIKETTDNNRLVINHASAGALSFTIWGDTGLYKGQPSTPWVPVSGQTYTITLAFGPTTQTLFVDGVSHATQTVAEISRNNPSSGTITIGSDRTKDSQGGYSHFVVYDGVQHPGTATFTPANPIQYSSNNPTALVNSSLGADGIETFTEVATMAGSDAVKYTLVIASQDMYWTGAAWANSNGTYAQSNTAAEINTNALALDLSAGTTIQVKAFLHADDGQTTPTLTSNTFTYNFFFAVTPLNTCILYGYVYDGLVPVSAANLSFRSQNTFSDDGNYINIDESTTSNTIGYFEVELPETTTSNVKVDVLIKYTNVAGNQVKRAVKVLVPNIESASLESAETT